MAHTYDFSSFEFSPLLLPSDIEESTSPSILRALGIYAQIKPLEFDTTTLDGLNDIADELNATNALKITEIDTPKILGVANFQTPRPDTDYLFLEGIAVHLHARKMELGTFMVQHLVEIARDKGKVALEGNVRPSMEPYYEKRGWDYVKDSKNGLRMRLDIE